MKKTSKEIREVLQDKEMADLKLSITDLTEFVKDGFKGIHARQDTANGRTGKLEGWQSFMRGGLAVLTVLVVPILLYLITHWK